MFLYFVIFDHAEKALGALRGTSRRVGCIARMDTPCRQASYASTIAILLVLSMRHHRISRQSFRKYLTVVQSPTGHPHPNENVAD